MPLLTLAMLILAPPPARADTKRPPPPPLLTVPSPVPVMAPPRSPPPAPPPVLATGTPARPINQMQWISSDDYPSAALRREAEGLVRVRLDIGVVGLPSDCSIVDSSGDADLDATACSLLLRRARFHPALDAEGSAITGSVIVPVRWAIPDYLPPLPIPPVVK